MYLDLQLMGIEFIKHSSKIDFVQVALAEKVATVSAMLVP